MANSVRSFDRAHLLLSGDYSLPRVRKSFIYALHYVLYLCTLKILKIRMMEIAQINSRLAQIDIEKQNDKCEELITS